MRGFTIKKDILYEKFDIIIQGKYYNFTNELIDEYLKLPFVNNIIVSCWEDDSCSEHSDRVSIIKNNYPELRGNGNVNLQIISSLNGLKRSKSKFSIKIRSDQKYTYDSMMKMYSFFIKNNEKTMSYQYQNDRPNNKIFVSGVYPGLLFHPRDHVFWGNTQDLIDLFSIPIDRNDICSLINVPERGLGRYFDCFTRGETYIGAHYCARFDDRINRMILNSADYLYDNSINWNHAKELSDNITFKVFKSFPKSIIDFNWLGKTEWNIPGIPWTLQPYLDDCFWHEDGF
jgi:hypothetical protein